MSCIADGWKWAACLPRLTAFATLGPRAPCRYGHCVGHCMHGDSCAKADCATGRRHSSVHLLSGAVLPLMKRLEHMRARSIWGRCARQGVCLCGRLSSLVLCSAGAVPMLVLVWGLGGLLLGASCCMALQGVQQRGRQQRHQAAAHRQGDYNQRGKRGGHRGGMQGGDGPLVSG